MAVALAVTGLAVTGSAVANAQQQEPPQVGEPGAVWGEGLTALSGLPILNSTAYVAGASSHARDGSNFDSGNYLYQDAQGGYVLMEASGPGVIDRFWTTGSNSSSVSNFGRIEIYFDGEKSPRVDLPADTFFSGSAGLFQAPLCGNSSVSSGGFYCDVRMPFARSVRVVSTGDPSYYNVGYETYPVGTPMQTFDPAASATVQASQAARAVAARAGADPGILPSGASQAGSATLPPAGTQVIAQIAHAGTIRAIRVSIAPHDDAALHGVWLQARWDGSASPAIDAPLGDVFLSGAGERSPARGLLAGYLPDSHTGYLYFPMPFARAAQVELVNRDTRSIAAQWQVQESPAAYSNVGSSVGELNATYAQDAATKNGDDYVLLDQPGRGKVVGISYTEEGPAYASLTPFMEGDERVYFNGSQTPQLYGTGTEDIFKAGYYYANGPFTLYDHGATDKEYMSSTTGRTSQYRLMLQDPWNFQDGVHLGIEHGGGDGMQTSNHSVVFWYGVGQPAMELTDTIHVGDPASQATANYSSTAGTPEPLTSFYEGDHDGNVSSPAFDAFLEPGSQPPPAGTDPMGESVTDSGLTHPPGATIKFNLRINPSNHGVLLRRRLDQATFRQQAQVLVDGASVGTWMTPANTSANGSTASYNTYKRWADSDFAVPAGLTEGKSRLSIELRVLAPDFVPQGLPDGWTDFRYSAYSITQAPPALVGTPVSSQPASICGNVNVDLLDVYIAGGRVRLFGYANSRFAGQTVTITALFSHRVVARARVGTDGYFRADAALPRRRLRASNRARYSAAVQAVPVPFHSPALKLSRRLYVSSVSPAGGARVRIVGRIVRPLATPRAPILVSLRDSCGRRYAAVKAAVHLNPGSGVFQILASAPPAGDTGAVYRLQTRVAKHPRSHTSFATFSLPRAVGR
jgi:hypothetical protein